MKNQIIEIIDLIKDNELSQSRKIELVEYIFKKIPETGDTQKEIEKPYIPGYWEPQEDDTYFHIATHNIIFEGTWVGTRDEIVELLLGNIFKTREEAKKSLEQRKAYLQLIEAIAVENQKIGFKVDWQNPIQQKYSFVYDIAGNRIYGQLNIGMKDKADREYFDTKSFPVIKNLLGEELIEKAIKTR